MSLDSEIEQTLEHGKRVDEMWRDIENRLEAYERDKDMFEREVGISFGDFVDQMKMQLAEVRGSGDDQSLQKLAEREAVLKQEMEQEMAEAEARHAAEQQLNKVSGKKSGRRIRNMI